MRSKRINLIPENLRHNRLLSSEQAIFLYLGFIILIIFISFIRQRMLLNDLTLQSTSLKYQDQELQKEITTFEAKKTQVNAHNYENLQKKILSQKTYWSQMFKELSLLIPSKTYLIYFNSKKDKDTPVITLSGESHSQSKIAMFYSSLENSQYFSQLTLQKSEILDNHVPLLYRFHFKDMIHKITDESNDLAKGKK